MQTTFVQGQDFEIYVLPFPNCGQSGAIMSDEDGFYSIYINSRVCNDKQIKALQHEITHMARGDLYSEETREEIEARMP